MDPQSPEWVWLGQRLLYAKSGYSNLEVFSYPMQRPEQPWPIESPAPINYLEDLPVLVVSGWRPINI